MPRRSAPFFLVVVLVLGAVASLDARPHRRWRLPSVRPLPRIVNGVLTSQYPTIGALMDGSNAATASMICSGTLIGCETFVTAAHCVEDSLDPADYSVFLQHAGFLGVESVAIHPAYDYPVADIAVLKLTAPVTGIAPTRIESTASPADGITGMIVGFGRSGGPNGDYGLKRAGAVVTAACSAGISGTTSICWNFTEPLGSPGADSNTCNGDSGGPLLVDQGSGARLAGVTSGGDSIDCLAPDSSYDTDVYFYRTYVQSQGGADLANTRCGAIPQVGETGATVFSATGVLDPGTPQALHSLVMPPGTFDLRVALNANDDGFSNFDLYVKAGSPPTTTSFDCRQSGFNQFGFCRFTGPTTGTWYVLVTRVAGGGPYQVTGTAIGVDCSLPANAGRACDDGNSCTGTDVCTGGTCRGTMLANGTPCDDGRLCTRNDRCQSGTCTSGPAPALGCAAPAGFRRSSLSLRRGGTPARDRLRWKWAGSETTKNAFGAASTTAPYALCLYDGSELVMERPIPPGSDWREYSTGFRYHDPLAAHAGMRSVSLKAGGAGRISVDARGLNLTLVELPLDQQPTVTVQLVSEDACWEARYSTHSRNDSGQFSSRSD